MADENVFMYFFLLWLFFLLGYFFKMLDDRYRIIQSYNPVPGRAADSRTAVPFLFTNPKIKYRS